MKEPAPKTATQTLVSAAAPALPAAPGPAKDASSPGTIDSVVPLSLADLEPLEDVPQQDPSSHPALPIAAIGSLVGGVYRILRQLGVGAMGRVMLAHDELLDRDVAIKLILPERLDSDALREHFVVEARAMARINHPNVLQIHAFGEQEGVPYFAMEYIEGHTLEAWLGSHRPTLLEACELLEKICQGVSAIHAAGCAHYDLKPSNILVGRDGRVCVADLGLASVSLRTSGHTRKIAGTPAYMAPEVALQSDIAQAMAPRVDVYSIGCLAYELFTGAPPFVGDPWPVLMKHASTAPEAPSARRPDIPRQIDQVILRALAKDPAERTATAEILRGQIAALREGTSEPARILLAEDDEDARALVSLTLRREFPEAEIECVEDGRSALEAFDRATPSVVLLDLRMPELDGMELTAVLRAREAARSVPILVLTGEGGSAEWRRLSALGADGLLLKPVHREDLAAMLRRTLRERSRALPPPTLR